MNNRLNKGFTLVEILVVTPMMLVAITLILAFVFNIFLSMGEKSAKLELQTNAQAALFTIRDDILFTNYFAGTVQPDANDPSKSGGWNAINDKALILSEVAYTANRQSPDRELVYKKDDPSPCANLEDGLNAFSTNTLIYFVEDNKLYLRTIVPDQSTNCAITYRKQSCPADIADTSCPADSMLTDKVKDFSITYYSRYGSSSETPIASADLVDPNSFIKVSRADLTLTLETIVNGEPHTATANVSLKKVN